MSELEDSRTRELVREAIVLDRRDFVKEQVAAGGDPDEARDTYNDNLLALGRDISGRDYLSMPHLPQLPDTQDQEIYDRIQAWEHALVAPNCTSADYLTGTAVVPDEVREVHTGGSGRFVFTAEHATRPVRRSGGYRDADIGTAGLTAALAEDLGMGIIMVGRQTSNAPVNPDHVIKPHIASYIPGLDGFMSVHGIKGGKYVERTDRTEVQAIVGIGANPTEYELEIAEAVMRIAFDLGLYAIRGDTEFYEQQSNSHEPRQNEDGSVYRNFFNAEGEDTTTNFTRRLMTLAKVRRPAFQVEVSPILRYKLPHMDDRDPESRVRGTALGFRFLKQIAETVPTIA